MGNAGNGIFQFLLCFQGLKDQFLLGIDISIYQAAKGQKISVPDRAGKSLITSRLQIF